MTATQTQTPQGQLSRIAYHLTVDGDPYDAQAVTDQAAAAYRASLPLAGRLNLALEIAGQALAGHTDPHRHFVTTGAR